MVLHDWTRVDAGTFHGFHTAWLTHLSESLNGGLLPKGYYSLPEQHGPSLRRTLTIRQETGHRIFAQVEILFPANDDRSKHVDDGAMKVTAAYVADTPVKVFLEHLAVGRPLKPMPLFLTPEDYINLPLEPTYEAAFRGMPEIWREALCL